jgi:rhodanese-related sulfurtransferase
MIPQLRVTDLHDRLTSGEQIVLVDVRQPEEYAICHLPNSILLPLGELSLRTDELDYPKDAVIVVYCHHGVRSLTGTHLLQRSGFTNVASLAGGIDAWSVYIDPAVPRY